MANPAYYDFFRKILLQPDNVTLEADSVTDTVTITRGTGVAFNPNEAGDSFEIDVDYQLFVPIGTTNIRLQDVNSNLQDISLRGGSGVQLIRQAPDEIVISAFGVAESDTLHTVAKRGRITDQNLIANGLTIGTVASAAGVDGMSAQDVRFIGDGTLNSPLQLDGTSRVISVDPYNETFTFTTANGGGILSYAVGMDPRVTVTSYSFTLEREDPVTPGNWTVIENEVGANSGDQIFAANQYAESHNGSVNWRVTFTAAGYTGEIDIQANFSYEVYDIAANPVLVTDSANGKITTRNIVPAGDALYDIGEIANSFANAYIDTVTGNLTGDVTGNADTATALATARDFSISGVVTASAVSFDGSGNVELVTAFADQNISQFNNDSAYITLSSLSGTGDITYNSATGAISFNNSTGYITLTNLSASGDISYNNTTGAISFNNSTGYITRTGISATGDISYDNSTGIISFNNSTGYITSETDTLASVTGRGATTSTATTFSGGLTSSGLTTLQQIVEVFTTLTGSTGIVNHDLSIGSIFLHTGISSDFTANFTNINLASGRGTNITLILVQGGTAYIPNAIQIGGASQTINWQDSTPPTGNANKTDIVTFSIINNSGTYTALGSLVSFGT